MDVFEDRMKIFAQQLVGKLATLVDNSVAAVSALSFSSSTRVDMAFDGFLNATQVIDRLEGLSSPFNVSLCTSLGRLVICFVSDGWGGSMFVVRRHCFANERCPAVPCLQILFALSHPMNRSCFSWC